MLRVRIVALWSTGLILQGVARILIAIDLRLEIMELVTPEVPPTFQPHTEFDYATTPQALAERQAEQVFLVLYNMPLHLGVWRDMVTVEVLLRWRHLARLAGFGPSGRAFVPGYLRHPCAPEPGGVPTVQGHTLTDVWDRLEAKWVLQALLPFRLRGAWRILNFSLKERFDTAGIRFEEVRVEQGRCTAFTSMTSATLKALGHLSFWDIHSSGCTPKCGLEQEALLRAYFSAPTHAARLVATVNLAAALPPDVSGLRSGRTWSVIYGWPLWRTAGLKHMT
jgi:hypothetical protein